MSFEKSKTFLIFFMMFPWLCFSGEVPPQQSSESQSFTITDCASLDKIAETLSQSTTTLSVSCNDFQYTLMKILRLLWTTVPALNEALQNLENLTTVNISLYCRDQSDTAFPYILSCLGNLPNLLKISITGCFTPKRNEDFLSELSKYVQKNQKLQSLTIGSAFNADTSTLAEVIATHLGLTHLSINCWAPLDRAYAAILADACLKSKTLKTIEFPGLGRNWLAEYPGIKERFSC